MTALAQTGTAVRQVASGSTVGPNRGVAVVALVAAGGLIFYDFSRSGGTLTDEQKLSVALSFGVGAILLLGLAQVVPELGVPLSVLLLLTVAVGRPQAVQALSAILARTQTQAAGTKTKTTHPTPSGVPASGNRN